MREHYARWIDELEETAAAFDVECQEWAAVRCRSLSAQIQQELDYLDRLEAANYELLPVDAGDEETADVIIGTTFGHRGEPRRTRHAA